MTLPAIYPLIAIDRQQRRLRFGRLIKITLQDLVIDRLFSNLTFEIAMASVDANDSSRFRSF